jgi:hypothetical protein
MAFQYSILTDKPEMMGLPCDRHPMALADVLEIHMYAHDNTPLPALLCRVNGNNADVQLESLDYLKNKVRLCFYASTVNVTGPVKPLALTLHKKFEELMAMGVARDPDEDHKVWCRALHFSILLTTRPGPKDVSSTPNATMLADALLESLGKGATQAAATQAATPSQKTQRLQKVTSDNGESKYVMKDVPVSKNVHHVHYDSDDERASTSKRRRTDFLEVNTPIVSTLAFSYISYYQLHLSKTSLSIKYGHVAYCHLVIVMSVFTLSMRD